jgi:glutathione S-transferase
MLTIHHLGISQSERIVWLCEELGVPYTLVHYTRDPVTRLSPPALRALHPLGAAPVIEENGLLMAESGAIMDYIIARYGQGRLALGPNDPHFSDYLYWFHFANSNLQPNMSRNMVLNRVNLAPDNPILVAYKGRLDLALKLVDARLGDVDWLAGDEFTAADIMIVFTLTTMREFMPVDLTPYPNILAYLQRVGQRPAYRTAMAKGDPGFEPMLT